MAVVLEPNAESDRPLPVDRAAFQRALQRLAREGRWEGSPRRTASALLGGTSSPDGLETVAMSGLWLLESEHGRASSFTPLSQTGPVPLTPEAERALRSQYQAWCEHRGGGDCLDLLEDGPWLRADDRQALAIALALGSVLDETREALARELLDARAVVSLLVWSVAVYCALWAVPEPTTKAVAASLSVLLVAWLGVDTVWGLMEGWSRMAESARTATTFEELRSAGEVFGRVLGEDAARAMILAVATLTGRSLGEVAAKVRALPGYGLAEARWAAAPGGVLEGVGALSEAVAAVDTVAMSAQGPLAVVMFKAGGSGGAVPAPGGRTCSSVLRHRGGNQQVELSDGQRWHLPRGTSVADIPAEDKVGNLLQDAVSRAAEEWGPHRLSRKERNAIQKATEEGEYWLARLLEREARGRYVHARVEKQFQRVLKWSHQGVDVIDVKTGRQYEILSGTESNLARHGRRMAAEFFRMITF